MEFIRQVMKQTSDVELKGFKILSLPFDRPVSEDIPITFCIDCLGYLKVRYGSDKTELQTGIRLQ
jgi:hypothetical protein